MNNGSAWTTKTDGVTTIAASHVNDLQTQKLDKDGDVPLTGVLQWDKGADVASASTLVLGNDGNYFDITGTTTITAINQDDINGDAVQAGTVIKLHFDSAISITHSTNLYLPNALSMNVPAGAELEFTAFGSDQWRLSGIIPVIEGWTAMTLSGTWVNFNAASYPAASYRKDANFVYLQGLIKDGGATAIATLPTGYRPDREVTLVSVASGPTLVQVNITTGGAITATGYSATWTSLDGLQFPLDCT